MLDDRAFSTGEGIGRLMHGIARQEGALLKAELNDARAKMVRGMTLVAIGALLALPALGALTFAAVLVVIEQGLTPLEASATVGAGLLVIGALLALAGSRILGSVSAIPSRTIGSFARVSRILKEALA